MMAFILRRPPPAPPVVEALSPSRWATPRPVLGVSVWSASGVPIPQPPRGCRQLAKNGASPLIRQTGQQVENLWRIT